MKTIQINFKITWTGKPFRGFMGSKTNKQTNNFKKIFKMISLAVIAWYWAIIK